MENLFLHFVSLSLAGSLFLLTVMVLRQVLRNAPKWIFCLLWALAALYFVLPFSVKTDVAVVHEDFANGAFMEDVVNGYVGDIEYIYEDSPRYTQALHAGRIPVTTREGAYVVTQKGTYDEPERIKDTWLPVVSWVWFGGVIGLLGYAFISYLRLKMKVSTATLCGRNIKESEYVDSPFVLGLLRPVIYLPYNLASQDREYVIAHEQAHIHRKDHWWKPIGYALLALYWFNPIMWVSYVLLCRDIEAACDEKVIRNMDRDGVCAYSTALLNCSIHRRAIAACPLAFGEVGVKERIKRVMHYKKPAFWIIVLAVVASVASAVVFLTTKNDPPEPQVQQTEPTESSVPETQKEQILALVEEIVNNPTVAASSNPYDYIHAGYEHYGKILLYGDAALEILLSELENSPDNGLREYIMAAACAELTGFGLNKEQTPWGSGKEWLHLFHQSLKEGFLGTEEHAIGAILGVDSLLGIDCVAMRIVAVEDHPDRLNVHRYSYRFQYYGDGTSYDWDAQEWYLVEIHSCLDIKMGDFDHDGVVELFYYTDTEEYPYYICDRVGDTLVEEGYSLVPDAVLDYDMLLNSGVYYLYQEQWAWFLKDPVTYVREVAKLPQDCLYTATPNGIIPEEMDAELVQKAYQTLLEYLPQLEHLKKPGYVYEKQIVYRLMTIMEYTYKPQMIPGQIDYRALFEKWGFTRSMSTEEKNCYAQLVAAFDIDPEGFIRAMAPWEEFTWAKDMHLLAGELAKVGFLYDAEEYAATLHRLEQSAHTEKERELVAMLVDALEYWKPPVLDYETLTNCSGDELWNAFYYAPDQVLEILSDTRGNLGNIGFNKLRGRLSGAENLGDPKLMEKGYLAIDRILSGDPTKAEKDTAYAFLMCMELYGGYRDMYTPGQPYDYQKLFDKLTYADGAFSELYISQAGDICEAEPDAFFRELAAWAQSDNQKKITQNMAMSFAYRFMQSDSYLKILLGLVDGMPEARQRELVQIFIDAYQTVQRTVS